jgi:hypothetical protein
VLAVPLAVTSAVWIAEYGRPRWLARAIESCIEIVAGTPDVVIALFGLAVFQLGFMGPFSFKAAGGGVYGRSFIAAGAMMSLIALPAVFAPPATGHEPSRAHARGRLRAGRTRITTIRRVLLLTCVTSPPASRSHQPHHRRHGDRGVPARGVAEDRIAGLGAGCGLLRGQVRRSPMCSALPS